jgi:hypothetical protein
MGPIEGANPNHWTLDQGLVLGYWNMDQVQKNSNTEFNTPSLEHFRVLYESSWVPSTFLISDSLYFAK